MKSLFGAAAIVALFSMPASAAGLPDMSSYNWTGFYLGGSAGYAWGKGNNDVTIVDTIFGLPPGVDNFSTSGKLSGWLGGVQAGYNWQTGLTVLGVEADISFGSMKSDPYYAPTTNLGVPVANSYYSASEKIKWFGTVRGRIGYTPVDHLLVYATGGLAFAKVDYSTLTWFSSVVQYAGSESATKLGWTLGAGTEWAIGKNWSAKFEYLYFDLGSKTVTGRYPANAQYVVLTDFSTRGNLVRIGLNRKF